MGFAAGLMLLLFARMLARVSTFHEKSPAIRAFGRFLVEIRRRYYCTAFFRGQASEDFNCPIGYLEQFLHFTHGHFE